jgi:hypothetical protein
LHNFKPGNALTELNKMQIPEFLYLKRRPLPMEQHHDHLPALIDDGDLSGRLLQMHTELDKAKTYEEVAAIRDRARLIVDAQRYVAGHKAIRDDATVVVIMATRKIGEALVANPFLHGRAAVKAGQPKLADLGLKHKDLHVARTIGLMPLAELEASIAQQRADGALSLYRTWTIARGVRGISKGGNKARRDSLKREAADLAAAPTAKSTKHFLLLVRDSLARLLPRFESDADRGRFLGDLRALVDQAEATAGAARNPRRKKPRQVQHTELRDVPLSGERGVRAETADAAARWAGVRFTDDPNAARREGQFRGLPDLSRSITGCSAATAASS